MEGLFQEIDKDIIRCNWLDFPDKENYLFVKNIVKEIRFNNKAILINKFIGKNDTKRKAAKKLLEFGLMIGKPVSQSRNLDFIGKVEEKKYPQNQKVERGYKSNCELKFHNDRCDIVALLCYQKASSGGETKLVSCNKVFSILKKKYPESLNIHMSNFPQDLRDSAFGKWAEMPIFSIVNNELITRYVRRFIEASQLIEDCPRLTSLQVKALDHLDEVLNIKDIHNNFTLKPGDLLIFNNHKFLHGRTEFTDSITQKRLLYRLWLSYDQSEQLPKSFKPVFMNTSSGKYRGGVWPNNVKRRFII